MKAIILIGCGTGGHCIPMVAMYIKFLKEKVSCTILTDYRGAFFFKSLNQNDVIVLKTGSKAVSRLEQFISFPLIIIQALVLLLKIKPYHIIGFGGFLTLPFMLYASFIGINISIHEANAVIGKANRILAKKSKNIFLTFKETRMLDSKFINKSSCVGLPLREEMIKFNNYKQTSNKIIISVIGGSQGSNTLANEVPMALIKFQNLVGKNIFVYHQCRQEDLKKIKHIYRAFKIKHEVSNYFNDMPRKIISSNIIVSRSGSSTINEIITAQKPSVLIPFPYAVDDHQLYNAKILKSLSCSEIISNNRLNSNILSNCLLKIYKNPDKIKYIHQKLGRFKHINSSLQMLNIIENTNDN
jgi:UDP-N-acetylglucosamine--N-acetylmuramyl-(pentapeptide) pyrophosphoryl-undecaprenol N-acetylglucosamine transferase